MLRPNNTMPARDGFNGHCRRRTSVVLAIALGGVALAGCDDYLERSDTLTLGVGDAIAVNKATQTIERWPHAARQDRWLSDGERGRRAVGSYRNGKLANPAKAAANAGDATTAATGADATD